MSTEPAAAGPHEAGSAKQAPGRTEEPERSEPAEQPQAQQAWDARRDLDAHAPRSMSFDGTNHGVTAQQIIGDVHQHYSFGGYRDPHASGEIPQATLERLADGFITEGTEFDALVERLRLEHVLVLTGDPHTGRRTTALMLLRAVGAVPVQSVDRDAKPEDLVPGEHCGQVVFDLEPTRAQPLREAQLLSVRDRLRAKHSYMVITAGHSPYVEDTIRLAPWKPPPARAVLAALLNQRVDAVAAERLLGLPAVTSFLARNQQLREVVPYADILVQADATEIEQYGQRMLEQQVREWFEESENTFPLREKAFLIALAAFNNGPYALTAELSDKLFERLRKTGDPERGERIPVFGTHIGKRLQVARARLDADDVETEWGKVRQLNAAFNDERTAPVLLKEVWTGHPAARPALTGWLDELSTDGRPFVRTRAAATVAVLALTDLPSAMALVIEGWADSRNPRQQLTAVSALTFAHRIKAPNIPRIIDGWSADSTTPKRCWVAIRAHGLIGPERPVETLAALRALARAQYGLPKADERIRTELPDSVALLLLSDAGDTALRELLRTFTDHTSTRNLALDGFLTACSRTDDNPCPPLLAWYARTTSAADGIVFLLRTALGDRETNRRAEEALHGWIRAADQDPRTEEALAGLLPALVTEPREAARLEHLLDTVPGLDGRPKPAAATRLHTLIRPLAPA
ncbi:hypothetical protein OG373_17020 [Streptomyces avidinii]|uniref:hypothetical protein n=1 Tax=Streptomyces avidinii TaxID=1895 RepID=UPI003863EDBB|nr:hypothetical protein OG373_17020 [Streptomyces avidinii]